MLIQLRIRVKLTIWPSRTLQKKYSLISRSIRGQLLCYYNREKIRFTDACIGPCNESDLVAQISAVQHRQRGATPVESLSHRLRHLSVLGGERESRISVGRRTVCVIDEQNFAVI